MSETKWAERKVGDIKKDDQVIINVKPGFEWVPGPYGSFVITRIVKRQDEVTLFGLEGSGADNTPVKLGPYDSEEMITIVVTSRRAGGKKKP